MKKGLLFVAVGLLCSCNPNGDVRDMELPAISADGVVASPAECDSYRRGDTIHFCYHFTDNVELGKFNLEIHSNHDHHTHSTSSVDCELDPERLPVNPWVFNQDYGIPPGLHDYTAEEDIVVPDGIDTGDYHFMIRLTDHAGWQQLRSVAIKIR